MPKYSPTSGRGSSFWVGTKSLYVSLFLFAFDTLNHFCHLNTAHCKDQDFELEQKKSTWLQRLMLKIHRKRVWLGWGRNFAGNWIDKCNGFYDSEFEVNGLAGHWWDDPLATDLRVSVNEYFCRHELFEQIVLIFESDWKWFFVKDKDLGPQFFTGFGFGSTSVFIKTERILKLWNIVLDDPRIFLVSLQVPSLLSDQKFHSIFLFLNELVDDCRSGHQLVNTWCSVVHSKECTIEDNI